jgi:hypothetical protein
MSKPQPPEGLATSPLPNGPRAPQKARPFSPLRQGRDGSKEPEVAVGLPPLRATAVPDGEPGGAKATDLSGRPPVWFLIGPNYSGKTTFARWAADRMFAAGRSAFLGALDPLNRTLAAFFTDVEQPSSADPSLTPGWLRSVVEHLMRERLPAIADMGGGDTSLARLISDLPGLAETMEEAGVAPVAAYFLGPRVDDLSSLATFEASGFRPRATLLVLNGARVDAGLDPAEAFAPIRRHSAVRGAVARGAVVVEMPRLDPPELALEVERRRLGFGAARDGEGGVGPLDRASVRAWMDRMERAFAPVEPWLP